MRTAHSVALSAVLAAATALAALPTYAVEPDTTPPTINLNAWAPDPFHPVIDGYRDTFTLDYDVSDDLASTIEVQLSITNGSGTEVFSHSGVLTNPAAETFRWDGRWPSGSIVPEGRYKLTFTAVDDSLNTSEPANAWVSVSHKKLVRKKLVKTVRAAPSKYDQFVGACSTLRKPSLRGWTGSLGYYSNTKCNRPNNFDSSVAWSLNATRVPRAFENRYHSLTIKEYGGAAKRHPGSRLLIQYWRTSDDEWVLAKFLGGKLGTHSGPTTNNAKAFVEPDPETGDRWVVWSAMTAVGERYDVRDFTVVLTYTALV